MDEAVGLTKEMMDPNHNMAKAMVVSYLVCLFQVFVITMVVSHLKVQLVLYSAIIGAMIALAFGLLSAVRSDTYIKRNMVQMAIDHGYDVVGSAALRRLQHGGLRIRPYIRSSGRDACRLGLIMASINRVLFSVNCTSLISSDKDSSTPIAPACAALARAMVCAFVLAQGLCL